MIIKNDAKNEPPSLLRRQHHRTIGNVSSGKVRGRLVKLSALPVVVLVLGVLVASAMATGSSSTSGATTTSKPTATTTGPQAKRAAPLIMVPQKHGETIKLKTPNGQVPTAFSFEIYVRSSSCSGSITIGDFTSTDANLKDKCEKNIVLGWGLASGAVPGSMYFEGTIGQPISKPYKANNWYFGAFNLASKEFSYADQQGVFNCELTKGSPGEYIELTVYTDDLEACRIQFDLLGVEEYIPPPPEPPTTTACPTYAPPTQPTCPTQPPCPEPACTTAAPPPIPPKPDGTSSPNSDGSTATTCAPGAEWYKDYWYIWVALAAVFLVLCVVLIIVIIIMCCQRRKTADEDEESGKSDKKKSDKKGKKGDKDEKKGPKDTVKGKDKDDDGGSNDKSTSDNTQSDSRSASEKTQSSKKNKSDKSSQQQSDTSESNTESVTNSAVSGQP